MLWLLIFVRILKCKVCVWQFFFPRVSEHIPRRQLGKIYNTVGVGLSRQGKDGAWGPGEGPGHVFCWQCIGLGKGEAAVLGPPFSARGPTDS